MLRRFPNTSSSKNNHLVMCVCFLKSGSCLFSIWYRIGKHNAVIPVSRIYSIVLCIHVIYCKYVGLAVWSSFLKDKYWNWHWNVDFLRLVCLQNVQFHLTVRTCHLLGCICKRVPIQCPDVLHWICAIQRTGWGEKNLCKTRNCF